MIVLIKHCIYQALRDGPETTDIPVVEHAGIHTLVSGFDFLIEAEVVVHRKMQVEHIALCCFTNPLFIKPVARRLGVAVKPELRPGDRTTRHSLLYEGARHKGDLIEEDSRQSNALNKGVAGFVSASEEVVGIRAIADSDDHFILAAALSNLEHTLKPCGNMYDNVTPKRFNRAAADSEVLFIEARHAPHDKADSH